MREKKRDETQRGYAFTRILGVALLALLMLVSIAGAEPYAYIANYGDGTVSVIDTATNTVTTTVNVGSGPHGTAITPDGTKVYVSNNYDDTVSVIDTATNTVTATVNVGEFPLGVAVSPDGSKVYVGNLDSKTVSIIDTATNTVSMTVNLENNPYLDLNAVSPDGTKVYMTFAYGGDSDIYVLDTSTNTITAAIDAGQSPDELSAGNSPREIAISPDGTKMYVTNIWYMVNSWELEDYDTYEIGTVSVIDTATNNIIAAVNIGDNPGDNPSGIAITPDGTKVYVANSGSNTVSVIDTETNTITDTLNVGDYPWKVAVNPEGTKVYVTNHNSNSVSVIDTETNIVTATVNVGSGPLGVAVTPTLEPEINTTQVTTSGSASDPHIYVNRIVYEDSRNGKSDIYMYDFSTKQEAQISTSGTAHYPAIYGDKIVWKDDRNGKSDIYMYDISTCQETQISTNGTAHSTSTLNGPDIYDDKIVWQELGEYTDETNLVMHSLSTQQNTQITTSGFGGVSINGFYGFAIHGNNIVMCSPGGDDCSSIDMYDLSTQRTTWISGGRPLSPEIYDDKIVYEEVSWDYEDLDPYDFYYNIYVYDLSTQQGNQVSASGTAYNPVIYGDRIVWEDDRNGQNVYMYDLSNSKETQITASSSAHSPDIYENRIVWVDGGNIYVGTVSEREPELIVSEIEVSDNRVREASPDTVYKSKPYIDVGGENNVRWRDVIGFDLSEYSSNSQISNAVLSLYWYYPAGETRPEDTVIEVYRPASTWNSDYVSWNKKDKNVAWKTPGGDWYDKNGVLQGNAPYATLTIKGSSLPDNRYYELDVTDLVKEYVSGKYENTGLLIKARTENNNYIAFYSSDWTNENQRPKITVTKKVPAVTGDATITGATDNRLREASPEVVFQNKPFIDVGGMSNERFRDVMLFNLSEYTDAKIKNADLSLYWYYPAGESRPEDTIIEVYRPASAWNPSYVSWNKKDKSTAWENTGGDWYDKNGVLQGSTPYATITIKGSNLPDNRYYELDVTDLVKEYVSGKYENTGFLIKARNESNNYIAFYSSDCGNENQVPKLQLVYS